MHLHFLLVTLLAALPVPAKGAAALCDHVAADIYHVLDCDPQDGWLPAAEMAFAADADDDDDSSDARRRVAQSQHHSPETPAAVPTSIQVPLPGTSRATPAPSHYVPRPHRLKRAVPRARAQLPDPAPIA